MRKTLLLVFIHGFKGGDDTFGNFPEHLRALVSRALPHIDVVAITYPKFETRGDLAECVGRFREWLETKVIDIEVDHNQPSPTVDPSVHVILCGHSMGGIVAAETLLLLASEKPLPPPSKGSTKPNFPSSTTQKSTTSTTHPPPPSRHPQETSKRDGSADPPLSPEGFLFPHIRGILTFDTPFLGIAPGVIAHGAEGHYKTASAAYGTLTELSSALGWGSSSKSSTTPQQKSPAGMLPSSTSSSAAGAAQGVSGGADAAAAPKWQAWGKYAMFAGAAGAVAAGGAAALYSQRDKLDLSWKWISSHLEFVGCLARPEDLKSRVARLSEMERERGIGVADLYTVLGKRAESTVSSGGSGWLSQNVAPKERTFCSLPRDSDGGGSGGRGGKESLRWLRATNDKAHDETAAHMTMFQPKDNPGYYNLGGAAAGVIAGWIDKGWYRTSTGGAKGGGRTMPEEGGGVKTEELDDSVLVEKV